MQNSLTVFALISVVAIVAILLVVKNKRIKYAIQQELENSNEEKQVLLDFLHIITEDIAKGANNDVICRRLVRATAFSCSAMSACMYQKHNDVFVPVAEEGLFPPLLRKMGEKSTYRTRCDFLEDAITPEFLSTNEGIVADVYNSGQPIFIKNVEDDLRLIHHRDDSLKIKSFIAVPVKFLGKTYGVLIAVNPITQKEFSQTYFTLARSLGEQGGLALYNLDGISALVAKSKMESDLRLAASVQNYLLPKKLPSNENFSIAVKYFPHQLIGGDFYDVIKMPDNKIGIVVADVSGKGISAAILMAVAQSKLHYIAKMGLSPAKTLIKLNEEIVFSMRTDMFITITFAVIESDASKVVIARAGHEKPIVYRANENKCVEINSSGMAVGMVEPEMFNEVIEDIEVPLNKNDVLVLYTDGVTEATNNKKEEFSTNRLIDSIVGTTSNLCPQNLNDKIIEDLRTFMGNNSYGDDFTLLSIKKI